MDALLAMAVVGTAQSNRALPSTGSAIDALSAQLPQEQRERTLLLTAGALALYRQAGYVPAEIPLAPSPAAPEELVECSARAAQVLLRLLEEHSILVPLALERLQQLRQHVSRETLVPCLIYGTAHKELRTTFVPVLGKRAHWLSQFNPAWSWVVQDVAGAADELPADAETIWQEGTLQQRCEILRRLHALEPARAREWLEAVWRQEKADVRAALLATFTISLSADDQPLLVQALTDRSEGLRNLAVSLLLTLPASPQVQKLQARGDEIVTCQRNILGKWRLTATLPEHRDDAWQDDINIVRPGQKDQTKLDEEYYLHLALARISPQHWETRFSLSPTALVAALPLDEAGRSICADLMTAALHHKTLSWYAPLLEWHIRHSSLDVKDGTALLNQYQTMLTSLPQAQAEALLQPLLASQERWPLIISVYPGPWSRDLSRAILQFLRELASTAPANVYEPWYTFARSLIYTLHPSCLGEALKPWVFPETSEVVAKYWQQNFTNLIRTRKRILEEI